MDVTLMMVGMAVLEKIAPRKTGLLAWALVGFGTVITLSLFCLMICGLVR